MKFLFRLERWGDRVCLWALTLSMTVMLGLTLLSLFLRWVQVSFLWLDPLVRHIVFFVAFAGGVRAIGYGQHIAIDLLGRFLQSQKRWGLYRWHQKLVTLASLGGVLWLLLASLPFVVSEWNYGGVRFLGLKSGLLVALIPFGLTLLVLRFFLQLFLPPHLPAKGVSRSH